MTNIWQATIERKYHGVLDQLEQIIRDCPDELWEGSLWEVKKEHPGVWPVRRIDGAEEDEAAQEQLLQAYSAFWNLAYHALFHLDFYLSGGSLPFDPPRPFREAEHRAHVVPNRTYTRTELRDYLPHIRQKTRATFAVLSDEDAEVLLERTGRPFAELLLTNVLHAQEHAAQLSLFLGQHGIDPYGGVEAEQRRLALRDGVRGRSDEEIDGFAAAVGGYARLMPMVFQGFCALITSRERCVVDFEVGDRYVVRVNAGGATVSRRAAKRVDATVHAAPPDFLRWLVGDLDVDAAVADGRIRIKGDQATVWKLFERS